MSAGLKFARLRQANDDGTPKNMGL